MPQDYVMPYHQIGRLLEVLPDLSTQEKCIEPPALKWLGRGHALVKAVNVGAGYDAAAFSSAVDRMRTAGWASSVPEVLQILYRALAHCELNMPAGSSGAFVPVGNIFDAFTALTKIFSSATGDVMIIDPYMDQTALTEFGLAVPERVKLRLLADEKSYKAALKPAAEKWIVQYGASRPVSLRIAPARLLHDRAILIDRREAWTITQSLKDFAKRAPAEIIRADSIAELKIAAYEEIWERAVVLA